jgi:D-alanyl-D-alanine carboxypeptidase
MMFGAGVAAGALSLAPAQARAVDVVVRRAMRAAKTPGASIAIVRDDRIVYVHGYGVRNLASRAPVDTDTVFRWGSISKQFAAACVLMLAGEGKLSLGDPVSRWFPSLTDANDITVRDLLNQVTGYRDYFPLDYIDVEMAHPTTMNAILNEYARMPLTAPPRTRWEYSNTNFTLVGSILERISGMSLPELYDRLVFAPVKAESDRASGYVSYWQEPPHTGPVESNGWLNAAGALAGTASDLARWDIGLMSHAILNAREFAEMTRSRRLAGGRIDTHYGFGIGVERRNGQFVLEHGGATMGFNADNLMLPDSQTAIVVLTNCTEGGADEIAQKVAAVLTPALSRAPASAMGAEARPNAQERADTERIRVGLKQLAAGTVPPSATTADFAFLLTPQNRRLAMTTLRAFGAIREVGWIVSYPRGGLTVTAARVRFARGSAIALLYETPAHRIAELMLFP